MISLKEGAPCVKAHSIYKKISHFHQNSFNLIQKYYNRKSRGLLFKLPRTIPLSLTFTCIKSLEISSLHTYYSPAAWNIQNYFCTPHPSEIVPEFKAGGKGNYNQHGLRLDTPHRMVHHRFKI